MPTSKLVDVNVLSIFLVEDHQGHPYVDPVVSDGLAGAILRIRRKFVA